MGVTPSLLSQIETDKVQPSLNTLYQLVSRLDLSMDELLGTGKTPRKEPGVALQRGGKVLPAVQRASENPKLTLGTGVTWERLAGGHEQTMEPLIITYPPRTSSSMDDGLVQYRGYEYGLILKGTLNLTLGFDEHVLNEGDSIHFDASRPHRYENPTDQEVTGVWFIIHDEGLRTQAQSSSSKELLNSRTAAASLRMALNMVGQASW